MQEWNIYRTLLDSSSDPIFAIDAHGTYLHANKAFCVGVGQDPETVAGKTIWDVFPKPGADQRFAAVTACLQHQEATVIEVVVEVGGQRHFYLTSVQPLKTGAGPAEAVVCISKDITQRKHMEEQLQRLNQDLEKRVAERTAELSLANAQLRAEISERQRAEMERQAMERQFLQAQKMESVGRLASGLAHDLNNLLTPILGTAGLLMESYAPGDPRHEDLAQIVLAGRKASDLTKQLLAFGRKQVVTQKPIDLRPSFRALAELIRRTLQGSIAVTSRVAEDLWDVSVDVGQVETALMNLAVNAQDAMLPDGGKLTLELRNVGVTEELAATTPGLKAGDYVVIAVRDTGCGMDPSTREKIFEPFFTTKPVGRGTGLGLATVFGVVEQHGGAIRVETAPGCGTTFLLYLPRSLELPAERPAPGPNRGVTPGGTETILLVEDNEMALRTASRMLQRLGYTVLAAGDAHHALALAAEHGPRLDLLISDVVMPGMNGGELSNRVAALVPGLKVLFVSGHPYDLLTDKQIIPGRHPLLEKPLALDTLAVKIREVLGKP